jgi:hypothetical protein
MGEFIDADVATPDNLFLPACRVNAAANAKSDAPPLQE